MVKFILTGLNDNFGCEWAKKERTQSSSNNNNRSSGSHRCSETADKDPHTEWHAIFLSLVSVQKMFHGHHHHSHPIINDNYTHNPHSTSRSYFPCIYSIYAYIVSVCWNQNKHALTWNFTKKYLLIEDDVAELVRLVWFCERNRLSAYAYSMNCFLNG